MARDQKELCKQLVNPSIYKYKIQTFNQQFCKQKTSFSQYSVLVQRRVSRHADTWRSVVEASLPQFTIVSRSGIMSLHMRIFDPQTRNLHPKFTDDCLEHLHVTALHLVSPTDRQTDRHTDVVPNSYKSLYQEVKYYAQYTFNNLSS